MHGIVKKSMRMKMTLSLLTLTVCVVSLGLTSAGCRKKSGGANTADVENAASKFVAAEPAPTAPSAPGSAPMPAPAQEMQQAVQAYKGGNFEDAVARLQKLRATPVMSGQQRMALNDAMAAVMGDIYALAAKGDPRAVQAVKQYELLQNKAK